MASQISTLLQHGWENLWKNKILWLFSSLNLIVPFLRFIAPMQQRDDLASSFINLLVSIASFYFAFMTVAGVSVVAYYIAIGNPIDLKTAFQAAKKLFWRIVALFLLVLVLLLPYLCIVSFSLRQFLQIARHNSFFISILLSIFAPMWYFPITETIANNSKIGKSIKYAWAIFSYSFATLALMGLLLFGLLYVMGTFISMGMILVQYNLDVSALSKLDFMSLEKSFPDNNLYNLMIAIVRAIWLTYSTSVFTLAYMKHSSAKMSKQVLT